MSVWTAIVYEILRQPLYWLLGLCGIFLCVAIRWALRKLRAKYEPKSLPEDGYHRPDHSSDRNRGGVPELYFPRSILDKFDNWLTSKIEKK